MDAYLLRLWQRVKSGNLKQEYVAKQLDLSTKQTSRYLQKWNEEGWLDYQAGRGRGQTSKLTWNRNVEQIYENRMKRMIDSAPIEDSAKYLKLDWSMESRQRLMKHFETKLGYIQGGADKLIIPRKYRFMTFNPLEALDVHSANLISNVYNRLVGLNENGEVYPELVHSWEQTRNKLRLYLRKDVKFHDGSILTAEDVVTCLLKLKNHRCTKELWGPITAIHTPASLVVDILSEQGCSYILQLLAMMNSSIYKKQRNRLSERVHSI